MSLRSLACVASLLLLVPACAEDAAPTTKQTRDPSTSDDDEGDGDSEGDDDEGDGDSEGDGDAPDDDEGDGDAPDDDEGDGDGDGPGDGEAPGDGDGDGDAPVDDGKFLDGALCHLEGNQVGIVGDSYIHLSGAFTRNLQDHARKAGALKEGEVYLDHALSGASLNGFPNIPSQWPDVLSDAERRGSKGVKLVIGTGGGNDVLVNHRECLGFETEADITDGCKQVVDDAVKTGIELFGQSGKDGVQAIIYFFYPHLPEGSLFNGSHPNTILDYAYPHVKKMCDDHVMPKCFFIDTRPPFEGKQATAITWEDGIHPTAEGSQIIADLVWDVMQDKCIASQ
jgi:lysophospholipase L1-like esterase